MPVPEGDLLDVPLHTVAGDVATLRSLLPTGPLVVVFLRHFG